MGKLVKAIMPLYVVVTFFSCQNGRGSDSAKDADSTALESSVVADTLSEVEEEIEEADESDRLDTSFDDFMFAFTHSDRLMNKRIEWPLPYIDAEGHHRNVTSLNNSAEFRFLKGDFFTVFYGNKHQVERQKLEPEDSLVVVERIDLLEEKLRDFEFQLISGKWKLTSMRDVVFHESDIYDFLTFYARFSSDTLYQQAHVEQPLKIMVLDPEEDDAYIEGTINSEQWRSFCPDVPGGVISNIRYGTQNYNSKQMIMQKSGSANGFQELFFFTKEDNEWHLTRYEN
ncbi:MAG: DUF4348 domain-containing protein [Bacteroidaceae bacterium]|nr:DUF4348 domain-containing protein [Bacteroidaceae bacterium]